MSGIKDKVYNYVVRKNDNVRYEYERYVMEHTVEHYEHRLMHWKILFGLKWHYQIKKSTNRMLFSDNHTNGNIIETKSYNKEKDVNKTIPDTKTTLKEEKILYYNNDDQRASVNKFVASIVDYDVISFDIFDTLIYRKVERPNDIFLIMSAEMGINDFMDIRKKAENMARDLKEKRGKSREVVLSEIYDVLESRFNISRIWMQREIELELNMSFANGYIYKIYQMLLQFDKTIVFTTDMYLPMNVIKTLVENNGYTEYDRIILSNEYGLRKGDGTLQQILLRGYPGKKIVHIGDNYSADVEKSIKTGIDAIYNPDSHFSYKEPELENIAGSFYRAVIQTNMNNGLWNHDIYYSHGYRVGGILAVGYNRFLNQIVKRKKIDKILFCARDCDILYKIYNQLYKTTETAYINISRYAIFNITSEHYLYDLSNRFIMRYIKMYRSSKTMETILNETGYGYLVNELEKHNIDRYQFPAAINDDNRIQEFIYNCGSIIYSHNKESRDAAIKYYSEVIGSAKNILVVDIGWSGTCITALKYFINKNIPRFNGKIYGALMVTNRNDLIKNSIQFDEIEAYLNTPFSNMDITRYVFPGPPRSRNTVEMDKIHMPFEYLFTSTKKSLLKYTLNNNGEVKFVYSSNDIPNVIQIESMQSGMLDFAVAYEKYSSEYKFDLQIPPYTAFAPIKGSIGNERYSYEVYKDYPYDAMSPIEASRNLSLFAELFNDKFENKVFTTNESINGKKILFISPEMIYSGSPRSLLRMCKVALNLGYSVTVWSAKNGPFVNEYENEKIRVEIVSESEIWNRNRLKQVDEYDLAICNTVMTSEYVSACCRRIPIIWYIREATNIQDFIRNNPERAYMIKHSPDIYVVSDYAAEALSKYADEPINVVHNCVEDEVDMALPYNPGSGEKVKFVQFGTMEYRKGYDVLLAAYKGMPQGYRDKSEVYFAGGFINSGTPFCSYLFREMQGIKGVHYLGLIQGEEKKIQTLSQMDVVVVASRDESCSLVALEGAMLSKPLIVTQNVGAKYMVNDSNGFVVDTGDVESLQHAMMEMIDKQSMLQQMGQVSRILYEKFAGMDAYTKSMKKLYALTKTKNTDEFVNRRNHNREIFSKDYRQKHPVEHMKTPEELTELNDMVVISLTSYPDRINIVEKTIKTLIEQTVRPKKIILWLSEEEFSKKDKSLPKTLIVYKSIYDFFEIKYVKDDIKPHKKYFYVMQEYQDDPVIIVDDDVYYDKHLVEYLLESYIRFPDCVSAMRTNLMGFQRDGTIMDYDGWTMGYQVLQNTPSTQLVPTGVGGVLYPPHALPQEAFDIDTIKDICLFCDDLWLKLWICHMRIKVVMPEHFCVESLIEGSQDTALWRNNVRQGNNNKCLSKILQYYENNTGKLEELIQWIRRDRFC